MLIQKIGILRPKPVYNFENKFDILPNISNIMCDRNFLLQDDLKDTNNFLENTNNTYKCPEISLFVNNVPTTALLDTGANVTCISEQWVIENKTRLGQFEELPLTGVHIKTAVGEKSKRVSKILLMNVSINGVKSTLQLIMVPNLVHNLILGMDTIKLWKMTINFNDNMIKLNINNNDMLLKFDGNYYEGILCYLMNNNDDDYDDIYDYYENSHENHILNKYDNYGTLHHSNTPKLTIDSDTIADTIEQNQLLDTEQKSQLVNLLLKYQDTFSDAPGLCNKYQHHLEVKQPTTFKCQSYPVPLAHQDAVMQEINRMETLGIIERSNSTYINPIIPIIKKSGEIRLCLDARKINQILVPDYECNRSVNELLAKACNAKWLTSIDLTASYWQIPLDIESRPYTGFQFRGNTYHYKVVPFGVSTSQAALVHALYRVFANEIEDFTLIYVDDICIISSSINQSINQNIFIS